MLVGELLAACHHTSLSEVDAVQRSPPEAGAEPDQGPAQGLRDVLGRHVAADDAGQHWPEREVVLPGDEHDPDVLAVPGELAEGLGRLVTGEPAANDEHPVWKVSVGQPLPGLIPPPRPREQSPPQQLDANHPATRSEHPLEQTVHRAAPFSKVLYPYIFMYPSPRCHKP